MHCPQTSRISITWQFVRNDNFLGLSPGLYNQKLWVWGQAIFILIKIRELFRRFWYTLKLRNTGWGQFSRRESCEPLAADPHSTVDSTSLRRKSEWTTSSSYYTCWMVQLYYSKFIPSALTTFVALVSLIVEYPPCMHMLDMPHSEKPDNNPELPCLGLLLSSSPCSHSQEESSPWGHIFKYKTTNPESTFPSNWAVVLQATTYLP